LFFENQISLATAIKIQVENPEGFKLLP